MAVQGLMPSRHRRQAPLSHSATSTALSSRTRSSPVQATSLASNPHARRWMSSSQTRQPVAELRQRTIPESGRRRPMTRASAHDNRRDNHDDGHDNHDDGQDNRDNRKDKDDNDDDEGRASPSGCPAFVAVRGASRASGYSPRMKASTFSRATLSRYCSGGDFMK